LTVPDSWGIQVKNGANLTLQGVTITRGRGSQVPLIHVAGEGTSASITDCTFTTSGESAPGSGAPSQQKGGVIRGDGLHVSNGASVEIAGCMISGMDGAGIWAVHGNSLVTASDVTVEGCGSDSFGAHQRAQIRASNCKAVNNSQSGFLAWKGGRMHLGPQCVADSNGGSGFKAKQGGKITASGGCTARNNKYHGFKAGHRQELTVDDSCVAEGNLQGDWLFTVDSGPRGQGAPAAPAKA
jgi:hypothetical protein